MLFQVFRWLGIFIYMLGIYRFVRLFVVEIKFRFLALLLAAFGGGLGWLLPLFGVTSIFGTVPLDYYSPETFGFLSLYTLPHLAVARGLMFMGITEYIQYSKESTLNQEIQVLNTQAVIFLSPDFFNH